MSDVPDAYLYGHVLASDLYSKTDDPARLVMQELTAEQIAKALQSMPKEYRIVSVLYFAEELSYQEISERLDVPVGTVRSRLHRGHKMFQKLLLALVQRMLQRDFGVALSLSEATGLSALKADVIPKLQYIIGFNRSTLTRGIEISVAALSKNYIRKRINDELTT